MGIKTQLLIDFHKYLRTVENLSHKEDLEIYDYIRGRSIYGGFPRIKETMQTFPIMKTIDIIRKRFPELNIKNSFGTHIIIEGIIDKLEIYIPIITNLGYSILLHDIDNKCFFLYAKPKYDFLIDVIPDIMYVVYPIRFKKYILKNGMYSNKNYRFSKNTEMFITDSLENANNFGKNIDDHYLYDKNDNTGYNIYEINKEHLKDVYKNPNSDKNVYYTYIGIKPENFKLITEHKWKDDE